MKYKDLECFDGNGNYHVLQDLPFKYRQNGVIALYDAIEDSNSIGELVNQINKLMYCKMELDRNRIEYVRLVECDRLGNKRFLKITF